MRSTQPMFTSTNNLHPEKKVGLALASKIVSASTHYEDMGLRLMLRTTATIIQRN
jgi:hypothetical protein